MKFYKLLFQIVGEVNLQPTNISYQHTAPPVLSSVEKYAKSEESLTKLEEELRKKAHDLGFPKHRIVVIKTALEVV